MSQAAEDDDWDDVATEVGLSNLFEAIRVRRRRQVILLVAHHGEITISEAAERIAPYEYGTPVHTQERKRVYVSLYQSHADKLAESGVLEFDKRSNTLTENAWTKAAAQYIRRAYREFDDAEGYEEVVVDGE